MSVCKLLSDVKKHTKSTDIIFYKKYIYGYYLKLKNIDTRFEYLIKIIKTWLR